eukprot:SAG31_NODE_4643_length_3076_cov_6.399059_2_plen_128_part_00
MFDSKNEKDGHEYRHFLAVAYWLHPDGGDDDEGVAMDMFMKKYTVKNWRPVPNPKFEVITPGSEWGVRKVTSRVTNRQIRKAIERDASLWNAPGAGAQHNSVSAAEPAAASQGDSGTEEGSDGSDDY